MAIEKTLIEAAAELDMPVHQLIRHGAHEDLTISTIANAWPIRTDNETLDTISGLVHLVPKDLLQGYNKDFVPVSCLVKLESGNAVDLVETINLRAGELYVAANEYQRFRDQISARDAQTDDLPPYLDKRNPLTSTNLIIAIEAWGALFASGEFDRQGKGSKDHIETWLSKHHGDLSDHARKQIATLVNPDTLKKGGADPTPIKKT